MAECGLQLDTVSGVAVGDLKALSISSGANSSVIGHGPLLSGLGWVAVSDNSHLKSARADLLGGGLVSLNAKRVLIDSDGLSIGEDVEGVSGHLGDVTADQQRGLDEAPEGEVCLVLICGHATIANLEHVGVIEAAWASQLPPFVIGIDDICE